MAMKADIESNKTLTRSICDWWRTWRQKKITDDTFITYLSGVYAAIDHSLDDEILMLRLIVRDI